MSLIRSRYRLLVLLTLIFAISCSGVKRTGENEAEYRNAEVVPATALPSDLSLSTSIGVIEGGTIVDQPQQDQSSDQQGIQLQVTSSADLAPPGIGSASLGGFSQLANLKRDSDGSPILDVKANVNTAWNMVGEALARGGVDILKTDTQNLEFFVRYLPPEGTLKSIYNVLSRKIEQQPVYRLALVSLGSSTSAKIYNLEGVPDETDQSLEILQVVQLNLQ